MSKIPSTMQACVLDDYGKLSVVQLPVPAPQRDEVLCRVRAIAICGTDPEIISGRHKSKNWPPYFPFVMGHEWSGEVVALGEGVTNFAVGDRVCGEAHCGCGQCENCMRGHYTICLNYGKNESGHRHYGFNNQGANAQYNAFRTKSLTKMPDSLDFAAATLCDTAGIAMHSAELAGVTPGGTVAIYGPGPIGLCTLGVIKSMGADRVIVVGRGHRLEVAGQMGADVCINFEKEDPVARIVELTGGIGADEVYECSGAAITPWQSVYSVRKGGKVALVGFYEDEEVPRLPVTKIVNEEIKILGSKANPNVSDKVVRMLSKGIVDHGKIISHRIPLAEYERALDIFVNRKENAVKVVIEP